MKRRNRQDEERRPEYEVIAKFGGAELVKTLDGKIEIRGGTPDEQAAARAWQEQFLGPPRKPLWDRDRHL